MKTLRMRLIRPDSSQAANHEIDPRDLDHGGAGRRQQLVIFTQTSIAITAAERARHNPPCGDDHKPLERVGALCNFQADGASRSQCPDPIHQATGIGPVGPDMPSPSELVSQDVQELLRPIAVLDNGGHDDHGEAPPEGIHEDVSLTPFDLLARVIAPEPPVSVVFTDWLSMMPVLGWRCLPAATRTSPRSRSCIRRQMPSRH